MRMRQRRRLRSRRAQLQPHAQAVRVRYASRLRGGHGPNAQLPVSLSALFI
jgi:hypothetical protein